ncbi:hypothetical protein [Pectobacterium carotovorum]|uniref:hypothetical protein n=1 Tax=Pectobacterium carotovorum TaxID=554 RepID=UPI0021C3A5B2|nr:hypothetical protein [Pectobacterium carotovorum]
MSLRDVKRKHQEAYASALRSGEIPAKTMKERPAGIVPCNNTQRFQPDFSFI